MTVVLRALAMAPVILHLLTGAGVVCEWGSLLAEKDSWDWWVATTVNCFRFGPGDGRLMHVQLAAWIQITAAVVVMTTLLSASLGARRFGYGLLLCLFSVTQARHILAGEGPEAIGFLYAHIFIFAVLVLHYERTCSKDSVTS